jgi:hypothetical protein
MPLVHDALDQRGKVRVREKNAGEEERRLTATLRKFVQNGCAALGVFVAGEDECESLVRLGSAKNAAVAQFTLQADERARDEATGELIGVPG